MKYNKLKFSFFMALAVIVTAGTARAQSVFLIVDRDTGAVDAVSNGDIDVDGYTISSPAGRLNADGWNSLADQGAAGWSEANPTSSDLSELNFTGSSAIVAGQTVSLGTAYNSVPVLPSDEDVSFEYSAGGAVNAGTVHYMGATQLPTISVDRSSGQVDLSNPGGFAITGYSIASNDGGLNADAFNSLMDQGVAGIEEANPQANLISELSLDGEVGFSGNTFNLGNIYTGGDISFEYATPDGNVAPGAVDFVGALPDLVLQVDLLSGNATIQNMSSSAGPFDVTGYSIFSESDGLLVDNWNSLADQGMAGWQEAAPRTGAIAELNPTGSMLFENGVSVSIGQITLAASDLVFEYGTTSNSAFGTVEYVLNLDGSGGGGNEPTCQDIAATRLPGDADGSGDVGFLDFLALANNFGSEGGYAEGNFDCAGTVSFLDFLTLANNFGKSASAAAVPEPSAGLLSAIAMMGLLVIRKRR